MTEPRKPELADVSVIPALVSPPDQTPDADTPRGFSDRMLDALGRFRVHPVTYGIRATVYRYGRRAYNDMLAAIGILPLQHEPTLETLGCQSSPLSVPVSGPRRSKSSWTSLPLHVRLAD
ncbi:MAG: hypothetical protein ACYTG4_07145, partial [Planctomycetota bacterium]